MKMGHTGHVGYKDGGHGQVKGGSIEIETISGRDDKRNDLPGYTELLHIFHGPGQRRFTACSGKGNGSRLSHGFYEFTERYLQQQDDRQKDTQKECQNRHR